jgi:hypothetical protein
MLFGAPEGQTTIMPTTDFSGWHLRQRGGRAGEKTGSALRFNRLKIIHSRYKVTYYVSYRRAAAQGNFFSMVETV